MSIPFIVKKGNVLPMLNAVKENWGVDVQFHIPLTSALAGDEWSASRTGRLTPGEKDPGTPSIGGSVGEKFGLENIKKR
jgi:hypothetical protein